VRQELERSRQELMAALRETERARTEAEAALRTKDQFLARLSHELRTPLSPVLFATEMLSDCADLLANMLEAVSIAVKLPLLISGAANESVSN